MARDYKFVMICFQDQVGSEDAKANIFVDGTQVATDVAITATSADSPQTVTFEANNLADPADGVSADIKVVLTNEEYVDASNDRNIWITYLNYADKATTDSTYQTRDDTVGATYNDLVDITDWSDWADWSIQHNPSWVDFLPTNVQGSQIGSTWWADGAVADSAFYKIPVWGDASNTGTTITVPLTKSSTVALPE